MLKKVTIIFLIFIIPVLCAFSFISNFWVIRVQIPANQVEDARQAWLKELKNPPIQSTGCGEYFLPKTSKHPQFEILDCYGRTRYSKEPIKNYQVYISSNEGNFKENSAPLNELKAIAEKINQNLEVQEEVRSVTQSVENYDRVLQGTLNPFRLIYLVFRMMLGNTENVCCEAKINAEVTTNRIESIRERWVDGFPELQTINSPMSTVGYLILSSIDKEIPISDTYQCNNKGQNCVYDIFIGKDINKTHELENPEILALIDQVYEVLLKKFGSNKVQKEYHS